MENLDPKPGRLDSRKKIPAKSLSLRMKLPVQKQDNFSSLGESDDFANISKANENSTPRRSSAGTSGLGSLNDVILTERNDSLCDFRSPVKDDEMNESLADFRVKPTVLKSNKRLALKESKSVVSKKRRNRDTPSNINQPSIESSFFKPQTTVKTAFVCPLCFKSYKDATAKHNHMKSCAAKNNVSTNKLLDAVELQEKQAKERKAMGLLAAPLIQQKKTISRKLISDKDPQLQLALALSMSLHEAHVNEEFEDAHLLAGEPCLPMNAEMTEERRKTLQNFGFTTNKPAAASTSGKSRKKRPTGPTALQMRTQEERDRLITVRIAEVLMGDEAITQALLKNVEKVIESEDNITLKSRLLRSYLCIKDRLWERSQQCLSGKSPYSCNLVEVSPCKVKPEPEIKEPEPGPSELKTPNRDVNDTADKVDGSSKSVPIKLQGASKSSMIDDKNSKTMEQHKTDANSVMNLSKDWGCMLGSTYMSDVLVIVKGDVQIHAHRVVFWARCNELLSDVIRNELEGSWGIENKILWPETEASSAEAFLEYIYCGVIKRWIDIFNSPDILAGVRVLARKYRLKKLFVYLRNKSNELRSKKHEISDQLAITETNLEPNTSDDNSSQLSEDGSSISSVETDINSVSTACNELASNEPVIDKRSSDGVNSRKENSESMNVEEKEKIPNNLVVDCFSSSNDSFAIQIPSTSSNAEVRREKVLNRKRSDRMSSIVAAALIDTTDIESLMDNSLSPSRTNHDAVDENDINVKLVNEMFEDNRCTSPDIFDDSTTSSPAYTYTVPKKRQSVLKNDTTCSDVDVEYVSTTNEDFRIRSPEMNAKNDETKITLGDNNSRKSEKPKIDCSFVSTRRRRRISKPFSANAENLDLESNNFDQEQKACGSSLKQKGDITMAIERIQRLNAKTASESDSECDSVETFPIKKHKNPFRINATDTSSTIEEIVKDDTHAGSNNEIPLKRRNKLSIFEKKIELEAAKHPAMFNLTTFKPVSDVYSERRESADSLKSKSRLSDSQNVKYNRKNQVEIEDKIEPSQRGSSKPDDTIEAFFDLTQESSGESKLDSEEEFCNTTTQDRDLSMFSKYRRKHSHNSIGKYRAALKDITSVARIKDTNDASSSDELLSSNDELFDINSKKKRNSHSSKYEYTDPNQSTSNVCKELSNVSSTSKERRNRSPQILSSIELDAGEESPAKFDDIELSDLEINLSEFSTAKSPNRSDNSKVDSKIQDKSKAKRRSDTRNFEDEQEIDSLTDIKLDDTDFTIMRNDCGTNKNNMSDADTDTECYIESISHSKETKTVDKIKPQSDEDKSSDIYNEETDTGDMEDKHNNQRRHSHSKMRVDTMLDAVSKETTKSRSIDKDPGEISSPDCEISGIFSPTSINLDFVSNVTNDVENLLKECKASSQRFRNSQINLNDYTPRATTSHSHMSASTSYKHKNVSNLLNDVSDSEFANIEFPVDQDFSKTNSRNRKSTNVTSVLVEKGGKKKNDCIVESDSSDSESSIIHHRKSSTLISSANRSKAMRNRSIQSSITPEKSSRSSIRTFKNKSISENIIQTKSKSGGNFKNDSSEDESPRELTPPIGRRYNSGNNHQRTPKQIIHSENVTPLANYSAMKTPELTKELEKYGLKAQKRHRAKQLLRHIYNKLHPLVPVEDPNIASSNESSSEDERPPPKRLNMSDSSEGMNGQRSTDNIESDRETLASDTRTLSDALTDDDGLESNDPYTSSQLGNSDGLENVFRRLMDADRSLYNKILTYEPIVLEELHSTLKAQGLKFKLNALKEFLDKQCITFRSLANSKSRTRRKANRNPKQNAGTQ